MLVNRLSPCWSCSGRSFRRELYLPLQFVFKFAKLYYLDRCTAMLLAVVTKHRNLLRPFGSKRLSCDNLKSPQSRTEQATFSHYVSASRV